MTKMIAKLGSRDIDRKELKGAKKSSEIYNFSITIILCGLKELLF